MPPRTQGVNIGVNTWITRTGCITQPTYWMDQAVTAITYSHNKGLRKETCRCYKTWQKTWGKMPKQPGICCGVQYPAHWTFWEVVTHSRRGQYHTGSTLLKMFITSLALLTSSVKKTYHKAWYVWCQHIYISVCLSICLPVRMGGTNRDHRALGHQIRSLITEVKYHKAHFFNRWM